MTNIATIANRALTKLGATRIVSLGDNSPQARTLTSMWNTVRDAALRESRWSFAITRAQLAADPTAPAFGYTVRYRLPAGFLRLLEVNNTTFYPCADFSEYRSGSGDAATYAIEGNYILAYQDGPLNIRYLQSVVDTSIWDATFVEAFASKLAAESCEAITQSTSKWQKAMDDYAMAIRAAKKAGAIELPPQQIADDTWVTSRVRA